MAAQQAQAQAASVAPPTPGASMLPNQQVAPLTDQQLAAMQGVTTQAGGTQPFLNAAQQQQMDTIQGQYLNPSTNQYLQQYYNAAAAPMTQQYQQTIAPNILQSAAQTGTLGSAGTQQAFQNANTSLSQGLGNLAANIYEPAYQQAAQQQQTAAQNAGNTASSQFIPSQELQQSGQIGQNQAQNVLQTGYQNSNTAAMWPFTELQMLGQGLGTANGGSGSSVSIGSGTSPSQGGMK